MDRVEVRPADYVWRALGSFSFGMVFRKQSDWLYQSNQPNRGYSCISELSFIGLFSLLFITFAGSALSLALRQAKLIHSR